MLTVALTLLAATTPASPAPVPMPGEAEAARFQSYFERGEALYQQAEFGSAIYFFKQADAQRVTPEVAFDLAKSYEKLGDDAFTVFYYRLYLKRAPNASDTLSVAELVGKALTKAEAEGKGFLELEAPRATLITVAALRFPEPPVALFLAPGEYDVEATFPTGLKRMKVQVRQGQTSTVSFEPVRPPMLALESALPAELLAKGVESGEGLGKPSGLRIGSYVTFGVGVAAVATAVAFGVMSVSDANRRADPTLTVSQVRELVDSANSKAVGANVLYAVGGAALAGAGLMFAFSMPEPGMKAQPR